MMQRIGENLIRLNKVTGCITISKRACEIIGLQGNDKVEFFQDEKKPTDWFITKTSSGSGFTVRKLTSGPGVAFNNTTSCRRIMDSNGVQEKTIAYRIGADPIQEEGMDLFALITKNPLK